MLIVCCVIVYGFWFDDVCMSVFDLSVILMLGVLLIDVIMMFGWFSCFVVRLLLIVCGLLIVNMLLSFGKCVR